MRISTQANIISQPFFGYHAETKINALTLIKKGSTICEVRAEIGHILMWNDNQRLFRKIFFTHPGRLDLDQCGRA